MDTFKAFFLLLLTLILNVRLSSSAPTFGAFAEEPAQEELTPVDVEESEEKHIPAVPGEAALSPENPPAKEVIPVTDKEPEPVPVEAAFEEASPDETTAEVTSAIPPEAGSPEDNEEEDSGPETPPISVIPLEASEDEAPEDDVEAELLPNTPEKETSIIPQTGEAGQIQQSDPEEQKETVPVIFAETSEEETPDENVKEEDAVGGEGPEETAPEDPVPDPDLPPEASVPLIPAMASQDEVPEDNEGAPEKIIVTDPDVNEEDEVADQMEPVEKETIAEESALEDSAVIVPATDEEHKEEAVVIFPIELETDREDELETGTEGTTLQESVEDLVVTDISEEDPVGPEEHAEEQPASNEDTLPSTVEEKEDNFLIPVSPELETEDDGQVETAPQEPPEATIPIALNGASEDGASEDHADAPKLMLLTDPDDNKEGEHLPSTPQDDTSVVVCPIELQTDGEDELETAAEGTIMQESVEDLGVTDISEEDPVAPQEHAEQEPASNEDSLPSTVEEEDNYLIPVTAELETEDGGQEQTASQEPPEATIPIAPDGASEDELLEDHADVPELMLLTNLDNKTEGEHLPSTPQDDTSVDVFPIELQTDEEDELETAAEGTTLQESVENAFVIDISEEDPVAPEEHIEEEPASNEDTLPSTLEEEEDNYLIPVPPELETEDGGQEQTAPQEPPEATIPIAPNGVSEDEASEDHADAPELMLLTDPDDNKDDTSVVVLPIELETEEADELETGTEGTTLQESVEDLVVTDISEEDPVAPEEHVEEEPASNEDTLPSTLEEEDNYLIPVPAELETEDGGQEQTAPQEPPEATIPIAPNGASEDELLEDHADAPELMLLTDPDNKTEGEHLPSTPQDDTSVVVCPIELQTDGEDELETAAEGTIMQESVEDLGVIDISEEDPVAPEEHAEQKPTANEDTLPSTLEEEDNYLIPVPAELETEGEGQIETAPQEPPEATIPVAPDGATEDGVSEDHADAPELMLLTDPDNKTEGEHLPSTPQDDTSVVVFPIELQTDGEDELETAAEGTIMQESVEDLGVTNISEEDPVAPQEHAEQEPASNEDTLPSTVEEDDDNYLIPVLAELETEDGGQEQTAPQEPPEATIPIVPIAASEDGVSEDHADTSELMLLTDPDDNTEGEHLPRTPQDDTSVDVFPIELDTDEADELETAAEGTTLQESVQDAFVIDISEEEPVAPEEHVEEESASNEDILPSTLEEEEDNYLIPVPAELETEDEGQVETAPQEPPEATIPIAPDGASEDEASEDHADAPKLMLLTDPDDNKEGEHLPSTPQDDTSVVVLPIELETEVEGQIETAAERTLQESAGEDLVVIFLDEREEETTATAVGATENVAQEGPVPAVPVEITEEDPATEEESLLNTPEEEDSLVPAPAEPETEGEEAAPEDPIIQHKAEDLNVSATMKKDEPVGQANRGAMLGAALSTQMSLIIIGFVGTNL